MVDENVPVTTEINNKGYMQVGGCDLIELKEKFGTPLSAVDEQTIRDNCRQYMESFADYQNEVEIIYASKALSVVGALKIIKEEGLGLDVVSGGELFVALKTGVSPKKIYFHGNNKSEAEIREALEAEIGYFVVDNFEEMDILNRIAAEKTIVQDIIVRITPGVEAHTHDYIQTGKLDSKFGIHADEFMKRFKDILGMHSLNFKGIHVHIGSQILELKPFTLTVEVVADMLKELKRKHNVEIDVLDLGGGLGVSYVAKEVPPKIKDYAKIIIDTIKFKFEDSKLKYPKLVIEPGRSIIARAGVTLYTVGSIKDLKGIRKYAAVDGGMADNMRPITYGAEYDAVIANKIGQRKNDIVTFAGKFCESGDIVLKDILIQSPAKHDVLVVFGTGAYNYSMASNYNNFCKPAMVLVNNREAKVIVKRETYEDITKNQII